MVPKLRGREKFKKKSEDIFGKLKRYPKGIYRIRWITLSHPEIISVLTGIGVNDPPARITRYDMVRIVIRFLDACNLSLASFRP
jgi:hypothetical protein